MKPGEKHIVSVAVVAGCLLAMLWFLTTASVPRVQPHRNPRVVAQNPDPRTKWRQFDVAGWVLCAPEVDSTGKPTCAVIPEGAILLIPVVGVDGQQPRGRD